MDLLHEVPGEGPIEEILVLGEAPGEQEVLEGLPFIGPSGQILRRYLAQVGLEKVRFENVVERHPPQNDFSVFYSDRKRSLPGAELQAWHKDLRRRINLIKPKIIIACGETALRAVADATSISDVHCYPLDSTIYPCKVIPVFHPAFILRQPSNSFWLKFGLSKAKEILGGRQDAPFTLLTSNTQDEIIPFLIQLREAKEVSIDIETIKNKPILTAIGISCDENTALSVTPDSEAWNTVLQTILSKIENPAVTKIGQNFMFDMMILNKIYGILPKGPIWDTMQVSNIIYSDLKKSLKELGRLYLFRPPWKGFWNSTGEKLRIYNAQDIIFTHRIATKQQEELKSLGLLDYYKSTPQALWIPAFKMSIRGIRIDEAQRSSMTKEVEVALEPLRASVKAWAVPFVPMRQLKRKKRDNKNDQAIIGDISEIPEKEFKKSYYFAKKKDTKFGLIIGQTYKKAYREELELRKQSFNPKSPTQVLGVLKNAGVKIPKVKSAKHSWEESTNVKALKKILERGNDAVAVTEFVKRMLTIRHGEKLISSYCRASLDDDARWRTSYNIEGTETGRSSTRKTPWGTGGNNQNIPRGGFLGIKFKKVFIPDEGKIFFQADQSQAEARVVAALSGCKKMLELFSAGQDIHTYAAASLLGEDLMYLKDSNPSKFKLYRQYAKIVNHGGNYDMGAATLTENALKDGIDLSIKQAEAFLKKRREIFPEIYAWHESIKETLHKTRTLWTPFGRRRVWLGKIGPEMYRESFAHLPQSIVPHVTNLMWLWISNNWCTEIEVLAMVHDSLLMQGSESTVRLFADKFIKQTEAVKFDCGTVKDFYIPWEIKFGTSWADV